ncbi:MAG: small multi-drug export protein [Methanomicrobiaceae archaeon]|uniref:small multi-drug export protein n=1 Tax=Methanoculleus sp. TaxID=90427 RepID=UPI00320D9C74|nr:small multi-drug export protein [Methanomicrobiaceae archaeon]
MTADHTTSTPESDWWKAILQNPYLTGLIKLILPLAIIPTIFAALYLIEPYQQFLIISGLIVAYFVPPAGKETIIPIAILMGYPWWLIMLVIFLLDVAVALFVVWNFDLALKIPLLGRLLESGMTVARNYTESQPWLRRLSTIGLILFVFFPLQGTGAMNGSILGRLLGLEKFRVFGCVCVGSFTSSLVIALGADVLLDVYRQDPTLGIGLLVAIVVAVLAGFVGWRIWKGRLRGRAPR